MHYLSYYSIESDSEVSLKSEFCSLKGETYHRQLYVMWQSFKIRDTKIIAPEEAGNHGDVICLTHVSNLAL